MSRKLRFIGESQNKVDGKGRVSIPASFRRVLEAEDPDWTDGKNPQFVIVFGDDKRDFLEVFTIRAIDKIYAKIERMRRRDPKRIALQRLYQTNAQLGTVDETGRLVLPAKLREKIGIKDEAKFAGIGESFEIWEPAVFETQTGPESEAADGYDPDIDASEYLDADEDV